ncbi:MAG: MG2 domain-containing protein, partial [Planctomycetota bacterium]|nr:MG2 domain-containing protein [Planctomycetota bacterium]
MNQGGSTGTDGRKSDQRGQDRANGGTALSGGSQPGASGGGGGAKFWVLAFALLLVNGLGWYWNSSPVEAAGQGPEDSVQITRVEPRFHTEQASEFRLFFDRDMCDSGQVGQRLAESPFSLTPKREGQWKWATPTELVFELAEPLPLGTRFQLQARPEFQELTGMQLLGDRNFLRLTEELRVLNMSVASSDPGATTLKLTFNQPVAPGDLGQHLKVTMDDQELEDWRVLTQDTSVEALVQVQYPRNFAGLVLDLHLTKDLRGAGKELGLSKAFERSFSIPRGFSATQVRAWPGDHSNTCTVSVRFNEPLALGQETPTLTFDPPVDCGPAHIRGRELRLTGPFQCGQTYKVTVGEALLAAGGHTLGPKDALAFQVPERSPRISLPDGNGLLMPDGQLQLALRLTNTPKVQVSASRLHANNLVAHLHRADAGETSRAVPSKSFEMDLLPNQITDCSLPLEQVVPDPLGVYRITVANESSYWQRDSSMVRVSDLALTVKRESHGLFVWVTSLKSGEPLAGATLEARTHNNQVLGRATSSSDGVARIAFPEELPDGKAFVVSATLGRDFAYLQPGNNTWAFDKVDTAGRSIESKVDAWMYTECGVYRPGETIHLTGVLRAPGGGFAHTGRYEVRLRRPDGRIDWRGQLTGDSAIDSQGMFQIDLPTRREGFTGLYSIDLWDLDEGVLCRKTRVNVEDFVPTRLELGAEATVVEASRARPVEAGASSPRVAPGSAAPGRGVPSRALTQAVPQARRRIAIDVDSKDFLGRPSKGLALRVLPHWTRQTFESEAHPDFEFGEPEEQGHRSFQSREQSFALDQEGRRRVELDPGSSQVPGLWKLHAAATVTETGGRSATHSIQAELDTANHHLGFRLRDGLAPVAQPMAIDWLFVGRDGKETDATAYSLRLERIVREYGMENVNGRLSWKSKERRVDVARFAIGETKSRGTLEFEVREAGHYRLLAQSAQAEIQAEFNFYAGDEEASSPPTDPQLLELTLDRDRYLPGDVAKLSVRGEFDGRLLVTLETDQILLSQVIEFQAPGAELSLELPGSLRGGAFVSASLIRGIDSKQTSWLPHRAKGLARVKTSHRDHVLPLAVHAPKRLAPGEMVTVQVTSLLPDLDLLK